MKEIEMSKFARYLSCALLCVFMASSACTAKDRLSPVSLNGYNHTLNGISYFDVKVGKQYVGGGFLDAGSGGGSEICCIGLPREWRPGLVASVTFEEYVGTTPRTLTLISEIPRYNIKTSGYLNVHFLRGDKIKVLVTGVFLGNKDYPIQGEEARVLRSQLKSIWKK